MEDMTKALRKRMEDVDPELLVKSFKEKGWNVSEKTCQGLYYADLTDSQEQIILGMLHIPTVKGAPGYYSALQLVLNYIAEEEDRDIMDVAANFIPKTVPLTKQTPISNRNKGLEKDTTNEILVRFIIPDSRTDQSIMVNIDQSNQLTTPASDLFSRMLRDFTQNTSTLTTTTQKFQKSKIGK
jgi:hypothetical protein